MTIIDQLIATQKQTLAYFNLSEKELGKTYAKGKWNVKQILHHLADAEAVLFERIKRTISNPGQTMFAFDQDKWAEELQYKEMPLSLSRDIFDSNRKALIYLTPKFYESKGENKYHHSETKERTLKMEIHKVANHNQGHLDQIKFALDNEI